MDHDVRGMKQIQTKLIATLAPMLLSTPAWAAPQPEEVATLVQKTFAYGSLLLVVVIGLLVLFMKWRDHRNTPLKDLIGELKTTHSVGPDTLVTDCAKMMASRNVGALIVFDGKKLAGIFTERDALNRVLAAGLDPGTTKVGEVMTKNPCSIPPTATVSEAMELVTVRRFRHIPVVQNNEVLGLISSGDLIYWLVKDQVVEVKKLVDVTLRS